MTKGQRLKETTTKRRKKNPIILIIQIILIGIMIYSGTNIVIWFLENGKTTQIMEEISDCVQVDKTENVAQEEKYKINFQELKSKNNETVAWLKVNGTDIEYPIVQGKDNSYYLTNSFDKTYNKAGWPFVDYQNKLDGTDKNIIVYGHNRRDGSMFESLKNVLTDEWYSDEENRKIVFITENQKNVYEVFSTYKIEVEDYYLQTGFSNSENFINFVNTLKKRSTKDYNVNVSQDDTILTLSTCADDSQYRIVLHAKKITQ